MPEQIEDIFKPFKDQILPFIDECLGLTEDMVNSKRRAMIIKVVNERIDVSLEKLIDSGEYGFSDEAKEEFRVEAKESINGFIKTLIDERIGGEDLSDVLDYKETICCALKVLLKRPSGSFTIFEVPETGKFVQFSGSDEEKLLFDLPEQILAPDEVKKVETIFSDYGYSGPETHDVSKYPGGPTTGTQTSFNVSFGNDVESATSLAVTVLEKVFGVNDSTVLLVTED